MTTTKSRAWIAVPLALGLVGALAAVRSDARACAPPRRDATLAIRTVSVDDVPEPYLDAYGDSGGIRMVRITGAGPRVTLSAFDSTGLPVYGEAYDAPR